MTQTLACLRLARAEGVGPMTYRRLVQRYGSARAALEVLPRLQGLTAPAVETVEREIEAVEKAGGTFLFVDQPGYPALLALLADAPSAIAVLGDPAVLGQQQVGVVGARNASAGGRRLAEEIAEGLAAAGIAVTSGLARGIDAAAHQGALRKGRTVAVVPGGLNVPYPPEHADLQARIAGEGGAVVAEAPWGTAPMARHFPKRNRIIAGLSLGVVVVEAADRSGTLITARMAIEAGREVYAVPGSPLDPRYKGSNDLIRQGAHLTEGAADVIDTLPSGPANAPLFRARQGRPAAPEASETPLELPSSHTQLLELIGDTPVVVDEVLRRCHLSPAALQAVLADLELEGLVETLPGNRVVRRGVQPR